MDQLANAVKITLGRVTGVVLEERGAPTITNDGVSIAKSRARRSGRSARGSSKRSRRRPTTLPVMEPPPRRCSSDREGLRNVAAGANPMSLKRGIGVPPSSRSGASRPSRRTSTRRRRSPTSARSPRPIPRLARRSPGRRQGRQGQRHHGRGVDTFGMELEFTRVRFDRATSRPLLLTPSAWSRCSTTRPSPTRRSARSRICFRCSRRSCRQAGPRDRRGHRR